MKKLLIMAGLLVFLTGCAAKETYETVADELVQPVLADPQEIWVAVPEDSAMPVMETENGRVYICKDYEVAVQTRQSGDLNATIRWISGFEKDQLTVISTNSEGLKRYDFVWTSAGENTQQLGRAAILDDGTYHYILSTSIDADLIEDYQEIWNGIFETFRLA